MRVPTEERHGIVDLTQKKRLQRASASSEQASTVTEVESKKTKRLKQVTKLGMKATGLILATVPIAAGIGLSQASVDDYLGANRTTYSLSFDSQSHLDLGVLGTANIPQSKGPLGLNAEVHGIPAAALGSDGNVSELLNSETLFKYTSLYTDSETSLDAISDLLIRDAALKTGLAEAALLLLVLGGKFALREGITSRLRVTPKKVAIALALETALAGGMTPVMATSNADPGQKILHSLDGTILEGTSTADEPLYSISERIIPDAIGMYNREKERSAEYTAAVIARLESEQTLLARRGQDERVVMAYSDAHCSYTMMPVIKRLAEITDPEYLVTTGDDTDAGSAAEAACVEAAGEIPAENKLTAPGNHDSALTEEQMKANGFKVLDGKIINIGDITALGDDDPERTLLFNNENIQERPETQTEMGERLLEVLEESDDPVTIVGVHEPGAAEPITAAAETEFLTSLIVYGHTHTPDGPRIIRYSNGKYTVVSRLSTAGGYGEGTLGSFTSPLTPPMVPAQITMFFLGGDDLVTRWQVISFNPDETVTIDPAITVPPADNSHIHPNGNSEDSSAGGKLHH